MQSNAAKGAIEIADDTITIKGQYVDDVAKYADELAEAGKNIDNIGIGSGVYSNLDEGLNFSGRALEHMGESARYVPIEVLRDAIKTGKSFPDPRGSEAMMYYTTIYRNGKKYNLEVLYDKTTNTIYHFEYTRDAIGNLPSISK